MSKFIEVSNVDFWDMDGDAYVITTNGTVKNDGTAVMGRGIAKQAKDKFPAIPRKLGKAIAIEGNKVHHLGSIGYGVLFSFPVKHHWSEKADLRLIEISCQELVEKVDELGYKVVIMVRPGCGNGQRSWNDVEPICAKYLDNRFVIVNK